VDKSRLHATRQRLTFLFTGLVFFIIVLSSLVFLATKYFNELRISEKNFKSQVLLTHKNIISWNEAPKPELPRIGPWKRVLLWKVRDYIEENGFVSYFILDEENEIIKRNILERPNFWDVALDDIPSYIRKGDMMLSRIDVDSEAWNQKIIYYRSLKYSLSDLTADMLYIIFVALILSVWVYLLGRFFITKLLFPIEENMRDMSSFIHNAGHELKTPLAVVRGNMQVMKLEKKYDEKLIDSSMRAIDGANGLIEWLRELSTTWKVSQKTKIDLPAKVTELLEVLSKDLHKKKLKVHLSMPDNMYVYANQQELDILVKNLLKNAIVYNTPGWDIHIKIVKNILTVRDSWIWIEEKNLPKIFDRLYREDASRNSQGYGIWLSLVKKIADANNWKIIVSSKKTVGTKFEIIF